jgi:hypothetical protein
MSRGALAKIRAACVERAQGLCECGCGKSVNTDRGELDHFFSRRNSESVETCWFIDAVCHKRRHEAVGGTLLWLGKVAMHCRTHGYLEALEKVHQKMAWVSTREQFVANAKQRRIEGE